MDDINIKFLPHFAHLLAIGKPQYLVYAETGGRGSGKTQQVAITLLTVGAVQKKRMYATRKEEAKIEFSSYQEIVDKINAGFWAQGWKYNATKAWNIKTKSTINFVGVNDINEANREALKGLANADIIWVDEAQTITMATLDVLMPLLGRVEDSCIIFTFNKIKEKLPIWLKLGLDNPAEHIHFNESNYLQNFLLPKAFYIEAEDCKKRFPNKYERDYMNNPSVDDDGKVVKNWHADNIQPIYYNPTLPIYLTCDFNSSPNCWLLAHKDDLRSYFFDEYCRDMSTGKLIIEVLNDYPHDGLIVINGDASGNQHKSCSDKSDFELIINELKRRGYKEENKDVKTGKRYRLDLYKANGSRRARYNAWNEKVLDRTGDRCIIVSPNCPNLIFNCEELKTRANSDDYIKPTDAQIKLEPMLRFLGHTFDAASYHNNYYFPIQENYDKRPTKPEDIVKQFKSHR